MVIKNENYKLFKDKYETNNFAFCGNNGLVCL